MLCFIIKFISHGDIIVVSITFFVLPRSKPLIVFVVMFTLIGQFCLALNYLYNTTIYMIDNPSKRNDNKLEIMQLHITIFVLFVYSRFIFFSILFTGIFMYNCRSVTKIQMLFIIRLCTLWALTKKTV